MGIEKERWEAAVKYTGFLARCILCVGVLTLATLLFIGCEDLFGGSDDETATPTPVGPAPPEDGSITVTLSATYSGDDAYLWCWLYAYEEWNIDHPPTVLAAGSALLADTTSVTLKTADDSFGHTNTTWIGTGGLHYDLYIITAGVDGTPTPGTVDGVPAAGTSQRYSFYPVRPAVAGNTTMEVDHLVVYSIDMGQLRVTLSGAAVHAGKTFGVGVFSVFDADGPSGELAGMKATAEIGEDGTAVIGFGGSWVPTRPEEYHVVMAIFLGETTDSGPQPGDLVYKITPVPWQVNGSRHMRPVLADFVFHVD